jgi:YbbR domain-containing protein
LVPKKKIPNLNQVVLYGASHKLDKFDKSKIKAFVDISAIKKEVQQKVKVCVWVDDSDLKVQFISPVSLELDLVEEPSERSLKKSNQDKGRKQENEKIKRDLLESLEK